MKVEVPELVPSTAEEAWAEPPGCFGSAGRVVAGVLLKGLVSGFGWF